MKLKKLITLTLCFGMAGSMALAGCGSTSESSSAGESIGETEATASVETEAASSDFDTSEAITVLSREDGSGTRGAFVELFGIEEENLDGEKEDMTTQEATITNNTEVMMSTVSGNPYAIGYCSLGSLNDSVKTVMIDGVEATTDNVANGTYEVCRPFNIVTNSEEQISDLAQDFIDYILSADGQAVISENGYIEVADGDAFTSSTSGGKIVVAGSSSVSPAMEKLKEGYLEFNADADIEIQTSDSTTGITSTQEGTCDIGMASRELKDEETGLTSTTIAMDGIAVIVNLENPVENLSSDTVKEIFTGEYTIWSEAQ